MLSCPFFYNLISLGFVLLAPFWAAIKILIDLSVSTWCSYKHIIDSLELFSSNESWKHLHTSVTLQTRAKTPLLTLCNVLYQKKT